MAPRRRTGERSRAAAGAARPLPQPLQPGRPHQGISDLTPAERYWPTPLPLEPLGELTLADQQQPTYAARSLVRNVSSNGMIAFQGMRIGVGRRYAGANLRLVPLGELVHIYYGSELLRIAALDRRRYYQPQATGRTRRP